MRILNGVVVSTKMNNTIVVAVTRRVAHPLYKKLLKRSKRYKVDTVGKKFNMGDKIKIVETRPISKDKYFTVLTPGIKKAAPVKNNSGESKEKKK
ncbi:MAG: 30S ribosomal protein S17 [Candidatus Levybacteria bacterium]|nr:30S ribosomal protein S17 [Candidatus Levybacteria bacterium]